MKKILLSLGLFSLVLAGRSQTVLNELYTDPNAGRTEFFEIYNGSGAIVNTDCFSLITYYTESGGKTGFYVLDLPADNLPPTGYYVGASANPYNVQGTSGTPNFSWNALPASGQLTKWERSGSGYVDASGTIPANFNDLFQTQTGSGAAYSVFLYYNGILVNAFFGGMSSAVIPPEIRAMPDLPVDMLGSCADFSAKFDATSMPNNRGEYVTATPGSDNGYYRLRDGQCGSWIKGAPQPQHTPGASNGAATGEGSLPTAAIMVCSSPYTLNYSVGSGGSADAYPVTIIVYEDLGRTDPGTTPNVNEQYLPNGIFDASDTIVKIDGPFAGASGPLSYNVSPAISPAAYIFPYPAGGREPRAFIVVFQTPQGCFDKISFPPQCSPVLPVKFSLFTAKRNNSSTVQIAWQTAFELNNSGFEVQRNINGNWETVAFVPTQASGGNSDELLDYSYTDMNGAKGISQYRIKQVDIDGKWEYSVVRAVRGEGVSIKTVIYPNPSFDGRVNVVFEEANGIRDIVLTDMSGRMIRNWTGVSNNNLTIDNLNPGMYALRITVRETGAQTVEKLVVNKR